MGIIESYNQTELSKKMRTPYSRIVKDKHLYIPVRIVTAQSRATKRGYTVRYIRRNDILKYLVDNPMKTPNEKKFKKVLKKD